MPSVRPISHWKSKIRKIAGLIIAIPFALTEINTSILPQSGETSAAMVVGVNRQTDRLLVDQVPNKTSALELVSIVPTQTGVTVTVKNASNKTVTGIAFATSEETQLQVDFLSGHGDHTIAPGKTHSQMIAAQIIDGHISPKISILAAILDDRTFNGDSKVGQRFLNRRKGKRERLQLILPIVKRALDSKAEGIIARVMSEIDRIPAPYPDYHIQSGANEITELVLLKLQDHLQTGNTPPKDPRHALTQIYDEYSRLLLKL